MHVFNIVDMVLCEGGNLAMCLLGCLKMSEVVVNHAAVELVGQIHIQLPK